MKTFIACLATAFVIGTFIKSGEASIKCYACLGNCNDEYTPSESQTTGGCNYCSKVKTSAGGSNAVVRSCITFGTAPKNGCDSAKSGDAEVVSCYCDTDKCNGSAHLTLGLITALAAVLLHKLP